jgi:uncharacterized protein (TIGR01777 family)
MAKRILITGATGLIGKKLIDQLLKKGHQINILSRSDKSLTGVKVFRWNIEKNEIDINAFDDIDTVIHLAGEGIADKRWSEKRKQQIIDSRVKSTNLLYSTIEKNNLPVKTFISASAVGFYGNRGEEILTEESTKGNDFLAKCCFLWEQAVNKGIDLGLRVVKIRIGVILSKDGGALPSLEKPIKLFVGAPLGTGKQWVPWIHVDDIIGIFDHAVDNNLMYGTYNASAPYPITNATLTKAVAKQLKRPAWFFNVPELAIKTILGEMSAVVLNSTNTSSQKLLNIGYHFQFINLDDALSAIYNGK